MSADIPAAGPALLHVDGVNKRFGAVVAAADITIDRRPRRARQPDRQQRRRQDHLRQHDHRLSQARRRPIGFDGRDITALAPRAITRLGVARSFQIPQLYGDLTVLDNMLVANACHDQRLSFWQPAQRAEAIERAERLLERFRLGEHRGRRVAELPGGVRKLLDIAMALTGAPQAAAARRADQRRLGRREVPDDGHRSCRRSADEAMTVLFVEHDMDIVERYAEPRGRLLRGPHHRRRRARARRSATADVRRYVTGELLAE